MLRKTLSRITGSRAFRVLKQFAEVWAVVAFLIALVANPLDPDLTVDFEHRALLIPSLVQQQKPSVGNREQVTLLSIQVRNRSRKVIEGIELQVNDVLEVLEVGARTSSSRLGMDLKRLTEISSAGGRDYYFPNLSTLPPGHNVQLQLVVRERHPFVSQVSVTSSADAQAITRLTSVSGITVFLYEYSDVLAAALLAVLIGLGLWRVSKTAR